MTPDEWRRVKEVLQTAVERDGIERAAFVERACAGDVELRHRVQELLASDQSMGEFLNTPVVDLPSAHSALASGDFLPQESSLAQDDSGEYSPGSRIGPYRVLREIGHGGMGTVYLAERADGQYRKQLAIKLVNPHVDGGQVLQRFRIERQVLAALDHPNIARFLDGGASQSGLSYLVMEYVEGVPIDIWCDSRRLPVRERLTLFRKICAAVEYAHAKQIIHRDIKPGNILVTADGTPKLLDFGIAKVLNRELSTETVATTIGAGPMTPEFASPEQIRGERVGAASDIYALAVVLYRLLTGQPPYSVQGTDPRQMAQAICEQEPMKPSAAALNAGSVARGESPTGLRRQLSGDLDNIVLRALRKEPERRYTSVAEFSEDLGRYLADLPVHARKESYFYHSRKFVKRNRMLITAAAAGALLALAFVTGMNRFLRSGDGAAATVRSIAVLPLENLSGDREQEYFADGLTDELIGDLARSRSVRVISRTSVMTYKNVRRRLPDIARSLGVETIAEGSVLRSGRRIRISVRLVDAPRDRPFWNGTYEGEMQEVLALQSKVAEAIAGEIHVTLTVPDSARMFRNRRVNLDAYDAYLKGRYQYFSGYTQESTEKAIAYFRQALDLDPSYAPAYAGLANCYWGLSSVYYPPKEVMPKAKWAALKALALDDSLADAHAMLALVRSAYEFNQAGAGNEFKRAIELKSSDAQVHLLYGIHLAEIGRVDEALSEVEQAQKLDPVSPFLSGYIGVPLFLAHRYDEAIQRLQPIVELHPDYQHPHSLLALAYEQKGLLAKAIPEMERAYELDRDQDGLAQLGHMYAVAGRTADAIRLLGQLQELSRRRYVSAYNIAVLYAGLGQKDEAFHWLQKVEEDRSEWFAAVNVDPRLDPLHSDPRFAGVLRSVGLSQ
jgi:serine/threonine protein kinase/Flp pilus assembly protein TadD